MQLAEDRETDRQLCREKNYYCFFEPQPHPQPLPVPCTFVGARPSVRLPVPAIVACFYLLAAEEEAGFPPASLFEAAS